MRSTFGSRLRVLVLGVITAYVVAVVAVGRRDLSLDALLLGKPGLGLTFGAWLTIELVVIAQRADAFRRAFAAVRARPGGIALAGIVLVAAVLRFAGLDRSKLEYAVDEQRYISEAGRMIEQATLDHKNLEHGGLPYYVQALAAITYGMVGPMQGLGNSIADLPSEGYLRFGRYAMAILGSLNVWALAWAVRPLRTSTAVPLAAALVLALDAAHVAHGRYVHDDLHAALFVTLAWGALLRLPSLRGRHADPLVGMLCGVAVAAKYYDIVLVIPLAAAVLFDADSGAHADKGARGARLLRAAAGMALGFFLASPYTVLHPGEFLAQTKDLHLNTYTAEKGVAVASDLRNEVFDGLGPVFAVVLVARVIASAATARASVVVSASFPVAFIVLLGNFHRIYPRYLLPLQPFFCATVVIALHDLATRLAERIGPPRGRLVRLAVAFLLVAGLAGQLPALIAELHQRAAVSSALQAERWIRKCLPEGSTLLSEVAFTDDLSGRRLDVENMQRVLAEPETIRLYDYVVLSELNYARPGLRPRYFELVRDLALVKAFDGTGGNAGDAEPRAHETRIYATRRFPARLAPEHASGVARARAGVLPPGSYTLRARGTPAESAGGVEIELVSEGGRRLESSASTEVAGSTGSLVRSFQLEDLAPLEVVVRAADGGELAGLEIVLERERDPPSASFRARRRDRPAS